MNGDITQLGDFLNTWLPEQFNKSVPPIVDRAEQTISDAHDKIRSSLRDNVVNSRLAVSKAQTTVMDHIADRLGAVESRIDTAHKKILTNLDEKLIPLETMIPGGFVCPTTPIPIGDGRCNFPVCDPAIGTVVGYENLPCPTGITGSIDNVPIGPSGGGNGICPPQPICPPQENCLEVNIWMTNCLYRDNACAYILPIGGEKLHDGDVMVGASVLCNQDAALAYRNASEQCKYLKPCKLPVVNEPPLVPFPPGCCPQLINIQMPPGGVINNNPIPTNPIVNQPSPVPPIIEPPYPYTLPTGIGLNIQMICAVPGTKPGKCPPAGDMAYYSLECNDDSKIKALWVEMAGKDLNGVFGDNNPVDWFKNVAKEILNFAMETNPLSPVTIGS